MTTDMTIEDQDQEKKQENTAKGMEEPNKICFDRVRLSLSIEQQICERADLYCMYINNAAARLCRLARKGFF